jgi:hypothetical protein
MRAMVLAAAMLLAACASEPEAVAPPTVASLAEDPESYDDKQVTIDAAYYGATEMSVLTSGFAESFPPRPVEPLIWVAVAPPDDCLQQSEGVAWADRVEASGTFRYEPEGGLGHLGRYEMAIDDADLVCVRSAPVSSVATWPTSPLIRP